MRDNGVALGRTETISVSLDIQIWTLAAQEYRTHLGFPLYTLMAGQSRLIALLLLAGGFVAVDLVVAVDARFDGR